MAILSSFCGLLTLQVGAAVLAVVFFTLAAVILAANIFDYHNTTEDWPINLVLMIFFVIGLIFIGFLMFTSSYSENRRFAVLAVVGIVILLCYWIILCCFSFFSVPSHVRAVCISNIRCPESLWIANLGYRGTNDSWRNVTNYLKPKDPSSRKKRFDETAFFRTGNATPGGLDLDHLRPDQLHQNVSWKNSTNEETAVKRRKRYTANEIEGYTYSRDSIVLGVERYLELDLMPLDGATKIKLQTDPAGYDPLGEYKTVKKIYFVHSNNNKYKLYFTLDDRQVEDEELAHINFGFPFIGAVILFVANLLFFIFAALIMWSWASELDWADYYIEDEPVIVYEED